MWTHIDTRCGISFYHFCFAGEKADEQDEVRANLGGKGELVVLHYPITSLS
jgi:hypothetical protein